MLVDRAKFLAMKPKKKKLKKNMGYDLKNSSEMIISNLSLFRHIMHTLKSIEDQFLPKEDLKLLFKSLKVKLDSDLIQHFADTFSEVNYFSCLNIYLTFNF